MAAPAIPLKEFEQEMASTRRLLERVPSDKGPWKPHEKSMALGHLVQLIASMPGWITSTLRDPHVDLAATGGYGFHPTDALLKTFDTNVKEAHAALGSIASDDALKAAWSLKHGEQVLLTMPRGEAVRQHLSHLVHHRGQLSVYLRQIDVPLPSIYGPTADERW
jgi:uncharacterized damage-inducible protein DinB